MALGKTIARLRARYIPDINIDGGLSIFLDKYLGSYDQRKKLINDIDGYIGTSKNIIMAKVDLRFSSGVSLTRI